MNRLVVVLSFALGVAVTAGVATAQDAGTPQMPARPTSQALEFRFEKVQWTLTGVDEPYMRDILQRASATGWTFESAIAGQHGTTTHLLLSRPKPR